MELRSPSAKETSSGDGNVRVVGRRRVDGGTRQRSPLARAGAGGDAAYLRDGTLRYAAEGREIVGHNGTCFNNRPLYCQPNTEGVVLAGDRPLVRLAAKPYVYGAFSAAIVRGGKGRWFHEYSEVESRYRCGRMRWRITDAALPGVPRRSKPCRSKDAAGFALRIAVQGQRAGDKLVWAFGGAKPDQDPRLSWDPVYRGNPDVCKTGDPRKPELKIGMVPEWCHGNRVLIDGQAFRLLPATARRGRPSAGRIAMGRAARGGCVGLGQPGGPGQSGGRANCRWCAG